VHAFRNGTAADWLSAPVSNNAGTLAPLNKLPSRHSLNKSTSKRLLPGAVLLTPLIFTVHAGTLAPLNKLPSRHSLNMSTSKRLLPDAVFTPDAALLPSRTSISTSNPYAAIESKIEAVDGSSSCLPSSSSTTGGSSVLQRLGSASLAGVSDFRLQLSSGTTPNNSAAGGSGAANLTRCVAYGVVSQYHVSRVSQSWSVLHNGSQTG
jgi:hypothetical protein